MSEVGKEAGGKETGLLSHGHPHAVVESPGNNDKMLTSILLVFALVVLVWVHLDGKADSKRANAELNSMLDKLKPRTLVLVPKGEAPTDA